MSRQFPQDRNRFQHFALIYIDREGQLRYETSPSISGGSVKTVLSSRVIEDFLKAVAESEGSHLVQRPVHDSRPPFLHASSFAPSVPNAGEQGTRFQRRRVLCPEEQSFSVQTAKALANDKAPLRRYYEQVFQALQQTNCRVIAKAWVKFVEPRKQLQFPYNGRRVVAGKTIQFSPDETKPPWWPAGVRHREPDHLPKIERIALLVHILCELRASHGITAQKLKDAGRPIQQSILPPERLQLLDELYRVREDEELSLEVIPDGYSTSAIARANSPSFTVVAGREIHQHMAWAWVSQPAIYEASTQNTSICVLRDQAMNSSIAPVNPCATTNIPAQQDHFAGPGSCFVSNPVSRKVLKRSFSCIEERGLLTMPSSVENYVSASVASRPMSHGDIPLDVSYPHTDPIGGDLLNQ